MAAVLPNKVSGVHLLLVPPSVGQVGLSFPHALFISLLFLFLPHLASVCRCALALAVQLCFPLLFNRRSTASSKGNEFSAELIRVEDCFAAQLDSNSSSSSSSNCLLRVVCRARSFDLSLVRRNQQQQCRVVPGILGSDFWLTAH